MSRGRVAYVCLLAATLIVYVVMLAWSLPHISEQAGGLVPLDMRPKGYSFEEAIAFLSALSEEGRRFYLNTQHKLDALYPPLIGLTLAFAFRNLLSGWSRHVLILLSAVIVLADWAENRQIATLLQADLSQITEAMVNNASMTSLVKSGASTLAFCVLLITLAIKMWGRFKRGRNV